MRRLELWAVTASVAGLASSCIISSGECDTNGDCILSGETCVDGECVAGGTVCDDAGDCFAGQTCTGGLCVDEGCTANSDCPSGETCVGGECVTEDTTCDDAGDCLGGHVCQGGLCVPGSECTANGDCPTGETCVGGTCVTEGTTCDDADDCLAGQTCVSGTCEDPDVSFTWTWSLEGHSLTELGATEFENMCSWSNYWYPADQLTIRLLVDVDHDTTYDYYYDAECQWGEAVTDPATDPADYTVGDTIWFAFEAEAYDGRIVALSTSYTERTLTAGENDLGNVDYDWGPFGPLDVTLVWGTGATPPTWGGCTFPDPDVAIMGYLLRYSDGTVADEVDVDTDPMTCTVELGWLETEFDTYVLLLDGEDAGDTTYWGSTCVDLIVDDETSNEYLCQVPML